MKQHIYQTLAKKRYYLSINRSTNGYYNLFDSTERPNRLYGCNLRSMSFEDLFEKIKYYADENSLSQLGYINYEIEQNNYELVDTIEQDISLERSEFLWIDNNKYEVNSTKENEDGSLNVYINKIRFTEEIGLKECEDFKEKVEAMKYINEQVKIMQEAFLKIEKNKEKTFLNKDYLDKDYKDHLDEDYSDEETKDDKKTIFREKIKRIFK